ncbi:MAG: hypothetical protein GXY06_08180 [Clostridiaceae bacterium]|nr:hypothetical protein [Clostridiaceae bacterium]
MVEELFQLAQTDEKTIEKIVMDENVHYIHMIFGKDEGLPEHFANSNVYMTVLRGTLSIRLDDQDTHEYVSGSLLKIPHKTKMNVGNRHHDVLELIVIKAPSPQV